MIKHDFGPAEEADGGRDRADAAGDENLARRCLDQSVEVFLAKLGGNNRRAPAGQDDLAAVGVTAQDQTDAPVADGLGEVGIMREQDDGVAIGRIAECGVQVLPVGPEVADAAEAEPAIDRARAIRRCYAIPASRPRPVPSLPSADWPSSSRCAS